MPRVNVPYKFPAPVKGLNLVADIMGMGELDALVLENWIPYPNKLEMRPGQVNHVTGFANTIRRLWTYASASGASKLYATTDTGIFDATSAGTVGAAKIALTNGRTATAQITTGANSYIHFVNGTDNLVQFDGTTWSSVAAFGTVSTNTLICAETYRQRLFYGVRNSLTLAYLGPNSISGSATTYELGAIFRRGGRIVALGTWTIDGGNGAEDQFVVATSEGEVAVFQGSDPAVAANWTMRGVYYIGKPLGNQPLLKYAGDLMYLSEAGLFPLSKALLAATLDRTQAISDRIQPLVTSYASQYPANDGWQIHTIPGIPLLLINIPAASPKQLVMYIPTGAWATFDGVSAAWWASMGQDTFIALGQKVVKFTGNADFDANITATCLGGYTQMRTGFAKRVTMAKPYTQPAAGYSMGVGWARDFQIDPRAALLAIGSGSAALWGSATFGTALWGSATALHQDWAGATDLDSLWKALYLQVASKNTRVSFLGADARIIRGQGMGY